MIDLTTESDIQKEIVKYFKEAGCKVIKTGQYAGKSQRTINTNGLPDLCIRHKAWPRALWLLMEVKKPKGNIRPDQQELFDQGGSFIVYSLDDAIQFYQIFVDSWRLYPATILGV